ncbi:DUF4230 domain-containing protein [Robertmurraya sp. FSL R5-0851]|uniref:DUF4230 domain-containing protein n=1 Tax=Robertmurraya sp. FSL R5-0851 TaxID=2921584 RepID=UPI0030F53004
MNEKEVQSQLEALQKELTEAKQQMAASLAFNEIHHHNQSKVRGIPKSIVWKLLGMVLSILVIIGIIFTIKGTHQATVQSGSFIEQIKDLSSLASSQAYVKAVIEKEDNQLFGKDISTNLPGTKRKFLLIIPGTVTAGVDLAGITETNLHVNEEEKIIEIKLPQASIIQEPTLDFDQAQVFSVEGIFRNEVNWNEAYELAEEAKGLVKEEAISQGLIQVAEQNAEKTFTEFFSALGYRTVITYEE